MGIEPTTSILARLHSTSELRLHVGADGEDRTRFLGLEGQVPTEGTRSEWGQGRESNQQRVAYETTALPLSYLDMNVADREGIEPTEPFGSTA